ncbi:MAG TPA: 1,4-beta-xylanase [Verrucomicrobiae bacterium]|jgi:hypothetical protein|nr:1,4-beta-xylanase [Verrucomicrobiae bacterium]
MKIWITTAAMALIFWGAQAEPWPAEKANAWQQKTGWLVGCNFTPSTAINQLEMWQADTFDPATIDRELGWAEGLGFTSVRVFLHNLAWQEDAAGFLNRMEQFLKIADQHHIKPMFVFFDSCWDPNPKAGRQHEPKPFVHNSGWVQSPGREYLEHPERLPELKPYVQDVIRHFRADPRIAFWDLFNEPDNLNDSSYGKIEARKKEETTLGLLRDTFAWAREARPEQPISSGVWKGDWGDPAKLSDFEKVQLGESDIITFHSYAKLDETRRCVEHLRRYGRPIVCTEYMARPAGSTFDPNLGYFKSQGVGAYNWGFVSGKTQTIYPWDSWTKKYTGEPPLWFHDILRADGTPYRADEVKYIRSLTGAQPAAATANRSSP